MKYNIDTKFILLKSIKQKRRANVFLETFKKFFNVTELNFILTLHEKGHVNNISDTVKCYANFECDNLYTFAKTENPWFWTICEKGKNSGGNDFE